MISCPSSDAGRSKMFSHPSLSLVSQWKALPLPDGGYEITSTTILEFTLEINESVDFLAVCLDQNTDVEPAAEAGKSECVWLQSSDGWSTSTRNNWKHLTTSFETGVSRKVAIPMGQYRGLKDGEVVNAKYIGFIQGKQCANPPSNTS